MASPSVPLRKITAHKVNNFVNKFSRQIVRIGQRMSYPLCHSERKTSQKGHHMSRKKIILEPLLEERAGDLNAFQCRDLARLYERWARQLRVKAEMLLLEQQPAPPKRLRWPRASQLKLN